MISARMDRKITIQNFTETTNSYGETVQTWTDFATVWADVKQQSARETWSAGKISEVEKTFTIRYMDGITSEMRIQYDGQNYQITGAPREIGRREGLEIMTKVTT